MTDVTDTDINRLWWKAYNANDPRTAVLCRQALGDEAPGWEQEPDREARREVERIIGQEREADREAEAGQ
jgi:hypothetical protein